jgi:hypothetical protein
LLQKATGEQAVLRVGGLQFVRIVGAVEFVNVLQLGGKVTDLGRGELHLRGEFIGGHAGAEFVIAGMRGGVLGIDELQEIPRRLLVVGLDGSRPREIAQRLLRGHRHSLILRGEKAVAPVRLAVRRLAAHVLNGDVGRQVFVSGAERVADPRACAGEALAGEARVHVDATRPVRVRARGHAVDENHVVHMLRHVR